jgi:hypothetical protein
MNIFSYEYYRSNFRQIAFALLCLMIASMMFDVRPFILVAVFSVGNALFMTYERFITVPLDIELSTFTTILMTLRFGLAWGIVTAVATKMAQVLYNKDFNMNSAFSILQYVLIAFSVHMIAGFSMPIIMLGFIGVVVGNIFGFLMLKYVNMLSNYECFSYMISNLIFNFVMFIGFAEFAYKLLSL